MGMTQGQDYFITKTKQSSVGKNPWPHDTKPQG